MKTISISIYQRIMYIEGVAHKAIFYLADGSTISTIEKNY